MKTKQEIVKMIKDVQQCDDGHYYDRGECHYCGVVDGIQIALMWVLGEAELGQKHEDGATRLRYKMRIGG